MAHLRLDENFRYGYNISSSQVRQGVPPLQSPKLKPQAVSGDNRKRKTALWRFTIVQ
ncbi:hypothetical protein [Kingella kingae]|uniref:hypothetical protein n=1 Tax=Kingella kingae TaxID=504 RepID=UPI00254E3F3A|nr:hypothetical protein [Kingella kingae]MDK4541873.1 hypothetical protein [Kingella kingae]MDK4633506.1 hypothetical protein [Kingella kingae]